MSDEKQTLAGTELYYAYTALRRLRCIQTAELGGQKQKHKTWETMLFPRTFLLKLLNDRMRDLDELAEELVGILFKRFGRKQLKLGVPLDEQTNDGSEDRVAAKLLKATKCTELDGYFYHSLDYLYDYFVELDWYEPNFGNLSKSELQYVKNKLNHMGAFLAFQKKLLGDINEQYGGRRRLEQRKSTLPSDKQGQKWFVRKVDSGVGSVKSGIKSSLSSGPSASQTQRRVRFNEDGQHQSQTGAPSSVNEDGNRLERALNRDIKQGQSILALELLLFSLNLFVQRINNHLSDWISYSSANLNESLQLVIYSKGKIRTSQLRTISKQIKISNDVYLSILDYLFELKKIYLNDYVLGIICARDSDRLLGTFKRPRVQMFIKRIGLNAERGIISRLATQCLQVLLDLIISEINLPPVELDTETRTRSRETLIKSRENYFNFITSWLNVDDIVFGGARPKATRIEPTKNDEIKQEYDGKSSNLIHSGPQYKSSSRILAQMDNLNELARDLLGKLVDRLRFDRQHLSYFLGLIHSGLDQSFDLLATQLSSQLNTVSRPNKGPIATKTTSVLSKEMTAIAESIDSMAAKIRCLKCIHIISSLDKLLKELAAKSELTFDQITLERKLLDFTNDCSEKTGSGFG